MEIKTNHFQLQRELHRFNITIEKLKEELKNDEAIPSNVIKEVMKNAVPKDVSADVPNSSNFVVSWGDDSVSISALGSCYSFKD